MRDKVEEALMNTFNEPQPMVHCVKPFGRNPSLATFVRRHSGQYMPKHSTIVYLLVIPITVVFPIFCKGIFYCKGMAT